MDRSPRSITLSNRHSRWAPLGAGSGASERYGTWSLTAEAWILRLDTRVLQLFLRILGIVSRFLASRLGLLEGSQLWIRAGVCGFGAAAFGHRFEPLRTSVAATAHGWGQTERSLGAGS